MEFPDSSAEGEYISLTAKNDLQPSRLPELTNPSWSQPYAGKEIDRGAYGRVFEVDYEGILCAAKEVHALLLQYAQGVDLQKIKDDFLSECQIWSTPPPASIRCSVSRYVATV